MTSYITTVYCHDDYDALKTTYL